jgi:hypothetical protein
VLIGSAKVPVGRFGTPGGRVANGVASKVVVIVAV